MPVPTSRTILVPKNSRMLLLYQARFRTDLWAVHAVVEQAETARTQSLKQNVVATQRQRPVRQTSDWLEMLHMCQSL